MKKPGVEARLVGEALRDAAQANNLLDFLVDGVPLQEPVVLLLLDPLGDGLLVPECEIA
jgi:hypothetical protein